jgi:fumarylacetoacetate (FAA) hydrolase
MPDGRLATVEVADAYYPLKVDGRLASVRAAMDRPARTGERIALDDARLLCPLDDVPSIRDFADFEQHMVNVRLGTGKALPESWYKAPAFYFSNPGLVVGPEEPVHMPRDCRCMDFELSVACVMGAEVADAAPSEVDLGAVIAGFVLFNDWSARDLQMVQRDLELGPGKGKDFANGIGPWLVTADELGGLSGRPDWTVCARVNGKTVATGSLKDMYFSWEEIISHASRNTRLRVGDVLTCGTVPPGSIVELRRVHGRESYPWLRPGDVVELYGGALGVLRNEVAAPRSAGQVE